MLRVIHRPAAERGRTNLGWLDSHHSFSFGSFLDPAHMGYRCLRVFNDDIVAPGTGFGKHPHRDAEIFSFVISGRLEHADSMGNRRVIEAGEMQYMSAGSGVTHSEFNASKTEPVHFLQFWILPIEPGGQPRYADVAVRNAVPAGSLATFFAPEAGDGIHAIRAPARVCYGHGQASFPLDVPQVGGAYLHAISGAVHIEGVTLQPGDAATIEHNKAVPIETTPDAEFLVLLLDS